MSRYKHLFTSKEDFLKEVLKVNHAGELGAKEIYLGQLKALPEDREILEMLEGELVHLEFFENEIKKHGYAPSILNPLWRRLAFVMGFISAKLGREKAMLCTYKVEEVIEKHYQKQIDCLDDGYLKDAILKFRKDELEHMYQGRDACTKHSPFLSFAFSFISKLGIFLSSRF